MKIKTKWNDAPGMTACPCCFRVRLLGCTTHEAKRGRSRAIRRAAKRALKVAVDE